MKCLEGNLIGLLIMYDVLIVLLMFVGFVDGCYEIRVGCRNFKGSFVIFFRKIYMYGIFRILEFKYVLWNLLYFCINIIIL